MMLMLMLTDTAVEEYARVLGKRTLWTWVDAILFRMLLYTRIPTSQTHTTDTFKLALALLY